MIPTFFLLLETMPMGLILAAILSFILKLMIRLLMRCLLYNNDPQLLSAINRCRIDKITVQPIICASGTCDVLNDAPSIRVYLRQSKLLSSEVQMLAKKSTSIYLHLAYFETTMHVKQDLSGMMVEFAKNLADFAVASGKKHAIVLSALDFGRLQKIDMSSGMQTYYLSSTHNDGTDDYCEQLGWKRVQDYNPAQRSWKYLSTLAEGKATQKNILPFEDELEEEDYHPSLPFSALFSCLKEKGLKVTCLLCYCSEGDNISDAFHLAEAASKFLGLSSDNFHGDENGKWLIPFSWKTVYGSPPDMSIF